jgi:hypothetical protein
MTRVFSPYATQVEKVANESHPGRFLFHYEVREKRSGRIVFEGHAGDVTEAVESMNAWIDYAAQRQAA